MAVSAAYCSCVLSETAGVASPPLTMETQASLLWAFVGRTSGWELSVSLPVRLTDSEMMPHIIVTAEVIFKIPVVIANEKTRQPEFLHIPAGNTKVVHPCVKQQLAVNYTAHLPICEWLGKTHPHNKT